MVVVVKRRMMSGFGKEEDNWWLWSKGQLWVVVVKRMRIVV